MQKKLSEITRAEWITFSWLETTEGGDEERTFMRGYKRTPDEAMSAMEEWDATEGGRAEAVADITEAKEA